MIAAAGFLILGLLFGAIYWSSARRPVKPDPNHRTAINLLDRSLNDIEFAVSPEYRDAAKTVVENYFKE